jgi:hypothetical protein
MYELYPTSEILYSDLIVHLLTLIQISVLLFSHQITTTDQGLLSCVVFVAV